MLNASIELNKALKELADCAKALSSSEGVKACDLKGEDRVKASIKFLKGYELCVRVDEALRDIMRHNKDLREIERSLERAKILLEDLSKIIKSLNERESSMLSSYVSAGFIDHQERLAGILSRRPSGRIWSKDEIPEVATELSKAVESLRKSSAYTLLMCATNDQILEYVQETEHSY